MKNNKHVLANKQRAQGKIERNNLIVSALVIRTQDCLHGFTFLIRFLILFIFSEGFSKLFHALATMIVKTPSLFMHFSFGVRKRFLAVLIKGTDYSFVSNTSASGQF